MVCTDAEATREARRYILDSLWAFNSWFIVDHMSPKMQDVIGGSDIEKYCSDKCESANEWVSSLIQNKGKFVKDAIDADGRGHFLSFYDGAENEYTDDAGKTWYIYRQN